MEKKIQTCQHFHPIASSEQPIGKGDRQNVTIEHDAKRENHIPRQMFCAQMKIVKTQNNGLKSHERRTNRPAKGEN